MSVTEDCNDEDTPSKGIERRTFLTGVTTAGWVSSCYEEMEKLYD